MLAGDFETLEPPDFHESPRQGGELNPSYLLEESSARECLSSSRSLVCLCLLLPGPVNRVRSQYTPEGEQSSCFQERPYMWKN